MSDASKPDTLTGEEWRVGPEFEPEIRTNLARRAERELAQRSFSGAMVYFVVALLLALSTSYYQDYPVLLCSVAAVMFLVGLTRTFAARRCLRESPSPGSRTVWILRASTYATAVPWGLFCAITLYLYPADWTGMFLLLSTAALASGLTSSLAPDETLAARSLLFMVLPTIVVAGLQGDRGHLAFAVATAIFLAFLVAQTRANGRAFWKVSVAAEHERLWNSSERRRIEIDRATLAIAVEQAAEEILITDAKGNIRYCNPAFEKLTGYTRAEIVGQNPRFLNSGKQDQAFFRDLWNTILDGRVWTGRFTNRRKDGTLYEAEGTISPMHDADGRLNGFVAARHDVTERLQMELQLRQSQKLESIGRLAGGVAHDFNNLLTVILGYSRVLLEEHANPQDPMRGYVQEIMAAGERAASLTRQLLSFSRKQILMPRPIALDLLIQEMRPMLQRLVGEDIRVEAPPPEKRLMIRSDPDQMSQILMNLSANARDAMPHGGTLTIALQQNDPADLPAGAPGRLQTGPVVRLTVSDTGLGMDEQTRQRLFEPFFTTKEHGQGTGLGLATVYGIVQQSDGYIDVRSEPGQGSAFHIYLPLLEGAAEELPATMLAGAKGGSETILVVEDQEDLRRLVSTVLQSKGYRVLDAVDGRNALQVAKDSTETIDLLLTDVIMPDLTGKQVADQILRSRPEIRVLFMSGYPGDVIARKGVLDRGIFYLPKPFTIEALSAKVREVLDAG